MADDLFDVFEVEPDANQECVITFDTQATNLCAANKKCDFQDFSAYFDYSC
jgi:hypothetical protein